MLSLLSCGPRDLEGVAEIDSRLRDLDPCDPWVQDLFVYALRDLFDGIRSVAPAVAVPYNAGTLIAAPNGRLVGIDVALLEDYYDGKDWHVPGWLYDLVADRLDLLVVSHGHWDHCWVELIHAMRARGKPVIVPEGIVPDRPKDLPWGCWGVRDGASFWWGGLHFAFRWSRHAYRAWGDSDVLTTRIWDGRTAWLHTSDADTTDPDSFRFADRWGVDALLFKFGGVTALLDHMTEMERTLERVRPRRLILPVHLNELGHKGNDAALPYMEAYEHLARYAAAGRLGRRRYAVLFGNRVVRV